MEFNLKVMRLSPPPKKSKHTRNKQTNKKMKNLEDTGLYFSYINWKAANGG